MSQTERIGVIDVGGGLRSAYGAGVLDYCLDNNIHFDYALGVSAGAANITSYLAHQRGRSLRFYTKYIHRKQYMSVENYLRTGSYLGLDYIYGTLMNEDGEDPLDYNALVHSYVPYRIAVTDALSGRPRFLGPESMSLNHYDALKATACLPVLDKPYPLDGRPYFDGTISDPIPLRQAFADGCTKVVVILTRPRDFYRNPDKDILSSMMLAPSYPNAAHALLNRAHTYNYELGLAKRLELQGKVLIIAPKTIRGMSTLTKNSDAIHNLYTRGYNDALALRSWFAPAH
ncbi:patatin-like phospholipase family protein [Bifidobacterium canis]|uniref:Patatin family protein n=1 Tax=Bifidobacterium canis TaxID=2610880 RepID=A0A7K1J4P8_9BIFI|nr:patatin family protein [Bifidobacterium canis]MUH59425.1 patatin family protein [Bifidobacterium canis]